MLAQQCFEYKLKCDYFYDCIEHPKTSHEDLKAKDRERRAGFDELKVGLNIRIQDVLDELKILIPKIELSMQNGDENLWNELAKECWSFTSMLSKIGAKKDQNTSDVIEVNKHGVKNDQNTGDVSKIGVKKERITNDVIKVSKIRRNTNAIGEDAVEDKCVKTKLRTEFKSRKKTEVA